MVSTIAIVHTQRERCSKFSDVLRIWYVFDTGRLFSPHISPPAIQRCRAVGLFLGSSQTAWAMMMIVPSSPGGLGFYQLQQCSLFNCPRSFYVCPDQVNVDIQFTPSASRANTLAFPVLLQTFSIKPRSSSVGRSVGGRRTRTSAKTNPARNVARVSAFCRMRADASMGKITQFVHCR